MTIALLCIGESDAAIREPGRDIMAHLSRHGIHAELRVQPKAGRTVGETVLETCEAVGTGRLLMGAYEHSRFTETLFGRATKDVLAGATFPVFMAH